MFINTMLCCGFDSHHFLLGNVAKWHSKLGHAGSNPASNYDLE